MTFNFRRWFRSFFSSPTPIPPPVVVVPTPTAPKVRAVAVVIPGRSGVVVTLSNTTGVLAIHTTNEDGYMVANGISQDETQITVSFTIVGFKPFQQTFTVPPVNTDLFPAPTRLYPPPPIIRTEGKVFMNGETLYVPRWKSLLDVLSHPVNEQIRGLDEIVALGFNGFRLFAGDLGWANLMVSQAVERLPALLDLAAERGLGVEVTCVTGSAVGYDVRAHLVRLADIIQGRRYVLAELANEVGHPTQNVTPDDLRRWGKEIMDARGIVWAVGAADVDEASPEGVYPTSGGKYNTAHLDRGRKPFWEQVRRVREIYGISVATGVPTIDNEPIGADELDGSVTGKQRLNDPTAFFALGALDRAFTRGGVHHSEAGLRTQVSGPVQERCAKSYITGHNAVHSVLGNAPGEYKNVDHDNSPIVGLAYGEQDGALCVRAYSFITGNRGVCVLMGIPPGPLDMTPYWGNGWRYVKEVASSTAADGSRIVVVEVAQ